MGNSLVPIVMFGWLPVVVGMFAVLPPRRAVIWAFLVAWLFLPMAGYKVPGIPSYTKMSATCCGVLLGAVLFDTARLVRFRPRWIDLPMLVWCICPMASSLSNGLGLHDGLSAVFDQVVAWGLPYLLGRLYFWDTDGLRELAAAIFLGGLIYVPLCLIEIRMSPQLHLWVYGRHQHSFFMHVRYGGYRPMVFMQSGIMVGMWMCMTSLLGFWLWRSGTVRHVARMKLAWAVPALIVTAMLCKSIGAIVLMVAGMAALWTSSALRTRMFVALLIAVMPAYAVVRVSGVWDASNVVEWSRSLFGEERAQSLQFRLQNEDILAAKAMERPVFGWGGWGRSRVYDAQDRDVSVTDGLWIIALGTNGWVGLGSLVLVFLTPSAMALWRIPPSRWATPQYAPLVGLSTVLVLYAIDCLPNGMVNPIFMLCAGGIISCQIGRQVSRRPVGQETAAFAGHLGTAT